MVTTIEAAEEILNLFKRGSMTESEFRKLMSFVVGIDQKEGNTEPPAPQLVEPPRHRRRNFGRRSYGWVTADRAQDLDLIALYELGGQARRTQIIEHIERKWGNKFTDADREILVKAKEPRWEKTCHWGIFHLKKADLIRRPERGIQELTENGRQEAIKRMQSY
ncbi:MAG: winged helix-turn-helix domain-containing protein [Chloroflexi bacterium]|nr:winged helix-turn-helix domain-containing protein [Chloroflexota bacterium]